MSGLDLTLLGIDVAQQSWRVRLSHVSDSYLGIVCGEMPIWSGLFFRF